MNKEKSEKMKIQRLEKETEKKEEIRKRRREKKRGGKEEDIRQGNRAK
jgi:hypothetical protein